MHNKVFALSVLVCTGSFKGLSFCRSANLNLNLASGRGNIGAELSSAGRIKPSVMNRDATLANTLDRWLYRVKWRERTGAGVEAWRNPRS